MDTDNQARVAVVTGGTAGLGRALTQALSDRGWRVLVDGRDRGSGDWTRARDRVDFLPGDVSDPAHLGHLARQLDGMGRLDLLVHNASTLGPLPLRSLAELDGTGFGSIWACNVAAPHAWNDRLVPLLHRCRGTLVSISSDAAVEHYPTWGGYGATKAALDHLTLTTGVESGVRALVVDPGEMRTQMHDDAFGGQDISDRPLPSSVVGRLVELIDSERESGRYRLADLT